MAITLDTNAKYSDDIVLENNNSLVYLKETALNSSRQGIRYTEPLPKDRDVYIEFKMFGSSPTLRLYFTPVEQPVVDYLFPNPSGPIWYPYLDISAGGVSYAYRNEYLALSAGFTIVENDLIGIAFSYTNKTIKVYHNGVYKSTPFSGAYAFDLLGDVIYPVITPVKYNWRVQTQTGGQLPYLGVIPQGYQAWDTSPSTKIAFDQNKKHADVILINDNMGAYVNSGSTVYGAMLTVPLPTDRNIYFEVKTPSTGVPSTIVDFVTGSFDMTKARPHSAPYGRYGVQFTSTGIHLYKPTGDVVINWKSGNFPAGSKFGFAYNPTTKELKVYANGVLQGIPFTATQVSSIGTEIYPACYVGTTPDRATLLGTDGAAPITSPIPDGYVGWGAPSTLDLTISCDTKRVVQKSLTVQADTLRIVNLIYSYVYSLDTLRVVQRSESSKLDTLRKVIKAELATNDALRKVLNDAHILADTLRIVNTMSSYRISLDTVRRVYNTLSELVDTDRRVVNAYKGEIGINRIVEKSVIYNFDTKRLVRKAVAQKVSRSLVSSYLKTPVVLERFITDDNEMNAKVYEAPVTIMCRPEGGKRYYLGGNLQSVANVYLYITMEKIAVKDRLDGQIVIAVKSILELNGNLSHYEVYVGEV